MRMTTNSASAEARQAGQADEVETGELAASLSVLTWPDYLAPWESDSEIVQWAVLLSRYKADLAVRAGR